MANSFQNDIVRIDAIAEINPDKLEKSFMYKRIKYVDISSVDKGYITDYQELSLEDAPSRAQRLTKVNDFIISTVRPGNRSYAYIKNSQEEMVFSTGFAVIRAMKCDPRYLYYVLTSNTIIDYLASIADSKSAYPSINPSDIGELEIDLPPLETQKEIAHILGTLDDKIELNRKMNKTLEEIAQTLFKHWFIDFEFPNAEGKPYKSSGGEMIDSELGPIPKGWRVGTINDIVERLTISRRYTKADLYDRGNVPIYDQSSSEILGYHEGSPELNASVENPVIIFGDHTCTLRLVTTPLSVAENVIPLIGNNLPTSWVYYSMMGKQTFEEYRRHWMELIIKPVLVPSIEAADLFNQALLPISSMLMKTAHIIITLKHIMFDVQTKLFAANENEDGTK